GRLLETGGSENLRHLLTQEQVFRTGGIRHQKRSQTEHAGQEVAQNHVRTHRSPNVPHVNRGEALCQHVARQIRAGTGERRAGPYNAGVRPPVARNGTLMKEQHPIAVLGGGSFGTALANLLAANGNPVRLWMRDATQAEQMRSSRENPRYLKRSEERRVGKEGVE